MLIYLLELGVNCLFISVDLKSGRRDVVPGLQIRVPFGKLFSLFLIQNVVMRNFFILQNMLWVPKEPSQ